MNVLTNKKIELFLLDKPVSRVISDPKHPHENIMMRNTTYTFSLPAAKGQWLDVFALEAGGYQKGRELQKFLETAAGFAENAMQTTDPHKMEFWKEHGTVRISKDAPGVNFAVAVFDLSNPIDFVKYLVCKYNSEKVAPSWNERNDKPYYVFALRDPEQENSEDKNKTMMATDIMDKLTPFRTAGDRVMLYTIYNLFINTTPSYFPEHKITNKSKADDIYAALFDIIRGNRTEHLKSLDKVVSKSATELNGYRLVYEGIIHGVIIVSLSGKRKSYYDIDRELIGHSEQDVVNHLNSPKGSEIKLIIESKKEHTEEIVKPKRK